MKQLLSHIPVLRRNTAQANRNSRWNPVFHLCATHRQFIDKGCPLVPIPRLIYCNGVVLMKELFLPATWSVGWGSPWWTAGQFANCRVQEAFICICRCCTLPPHPCCAALKDQNEACSSLWMSAYLGVRLSIVWLSKTIKWEETITRVVVGVMNLMLRFNKNRL